MKHLYIIILAALFAACNNENSSVLDGSPVKMTFAISGDFTLNTHEFTRALEADGKTMTDVWAFDYVGGELKQQLHQTSDDADFGSPARKKTAIQSSQGL